MPCPETVEELTYSSWPSTTSFSTSRISPSFPALSVTALITAWPVLELLKTHLSPTVRLEVPKKQEQHLYHLSSPSP